MDVLQSIHDVPCGGESDEKGVMFYVVAQGLVEYFSGWTLISGIQSLS